MGKECGAIPGGQRPDLDVEAIERMEDPWQRQVAAMKLSRSLGRRLAETHPDIAAMYRDGLTREEIGNMIISATEVGSALIRRQAVGFALRELITAPEREYLLKKWNGIRLQRRMQALGEEGFRDHQREAARGRVASGRTDVAAMTLGRGLTPWSSVEKGYAAAISELPRYQHATHARAGRPNASRIAFEVNEIFHDGNPVRSTRSVGSLLSDIRRGKNRI